jgi:glucose/arabinose dehydrogenase
VRRLVALTAFLSIVVLAPPRAHGAGIGARGVVTGLPFPAAFTVAPNGRIFYGERFTGRIRVFNPANGSTSTFFTIPNLATTGEQGLLGIAVRPTYPANPYVFAYATVDTSEGLRNRIYKIKEAGGVGVSSTILLSAKVASNHNGGRIMIGPDGRLYAVVGDVSNPANSQDLSTNTGKVLRMTGNGNVPSDNPFAGSKVYAYGIRNSFGFTFDPLNGKLWETENGPECNDELNLIVSGRNYGWGPRETCSTPPSAPSNTNQDGPNPVLPKKHWPSVIAPTGAAFCDGCGLSGSQGTLFFGTVNPDDIRRVVLTSNRTAVQSISVVYTHSDMVLSVESGPDGTIYFSDTDGIYELIQT